MKYFYIVACVIMGLLSVSPFFELRSGVIKNGDEYSVVKSPIFYGKLRHDYSKLPSYIHISSTDTLITKCKSKIEVEYHTHVSTYSISDSLRIKLNKQVDHQHFIKAHILRRLQTKASKHAISCSDKDLFYYRSFMSHAVKRGIISMGVRYMGVVNVKLLD